MRIDQPDLPTFAVFGNLVFADTGTEVHIGLLSGGISTMGNSWGVVKKRWRCTGCSEMSEPSSNLPDDWVWLENGYVQTPAGMDRRGPYCDRCLDTLQSSAQRSPDAFELLADASRASVTEAQRRLRTQVLARLKIVANDRCFLCGSTRMGNRFIRCASCGRLRCRSHRKERCACKGRGLSARNQRGGTK